MAQPGYVTITGASQGQISQNTNTEASMGNSYQDGHTDELLAIAFGTGVSVPTDPLSGQPTGNRIHKAAWFVSPFCRASPLLWTSLCTGEMLQISIAFWRTATSGKLENYFTIAYQDCILVNGDGSIPQVLDPNFKAFPHTDTWAFTFREVTWTHEVAGTSGNDNWRKPNT